MRKAIAVLLLAVLALVLTGCGMFEDKDRLKQTCALLVDAVIAGDEDAAYAVVADTTDRAEFTPVFAELHAELAGTDDYSLRVNSYRSMSYLNTDEFTTTVVLRLKCDTGVFEIEMEDTDQYDTIEYMNIIQIR